mmetsp:Transcript_11596/g.13360  ORF Transcript_11596/g.13360 Transcript_11596/m.13360 type:complete len:312 (+) Transcript_11596:31-966(+)
MPHICEYLFGAVGKPYRTATAAVIGSVLVAKTLKFVLRARKTSAQKAALASLEKDMVHIFVFPRWSRGVSFSAPCLRLEAFLRLNHIPYVAHFTMDTSNSPTERLPYIVYNGEVIADSEFAAQYLTKKLGLQCNASLSAHDDAIGLAARRLVEGSLQYATYRTMSVDHPSSLVSVFSREFRIPRFAAAYFVRSMRQRTISMLNGIGFGDLTDVEYRSEMLRDLRALEALIGTKPFLLGDAPSSYDANVYAALAIPMQMTEIETSEFAYIRNSAVLTSYVARVAALLFPDMGVMTSAASLAQTTVQYPGKVE